MFTASNYTITTQPTGDVVTLSEAKEFCKIDTVADDNVVTRAILTSIISCEKVTNRCLRSTGFLGEFTCLHSSRYERYPFINIERSPLSSVSSVQLWDGSNYTDEAYLLQKKNGYSRILFNEYAQSVSRSYDQSDAVAYPIRIEFIAGYEANQIPELLKHALLEHVCFLYENRGDVIAEGGVDLPPEVERMYRQFRISGTF